MKKETEKIVNEDGSYIEIIRFSNNQIAEIAYRDKDNKFFRKDKTLPVYISYYKEYFFKHKIDIPVSDELKLKQIEDYPNFDNDNDNGILVKEVIYLQKRDDETIPIIMYEYEWTKLNSLTRKSKKILIYDKDNIYSNYIYIDNGSGIGEEDISNDFAGLTTYYSDSNEKRNFGSICSLKFYNKEGNILINKKYYEPSDNVKQGVLKTISYENDNTYYCKKNDLPTVIKYYNSGSISTILFLHEGKLHREGDNPARIIIDNFGNIIHLGYHIDGRFDRRGDKPSSLTMLKDDPKEIFYVIQNHYDETGDLFLKHAPTYRSIITEYYERGTMHRIGDKPSYIVEDLENNIFLEKYVNQGQTYRDGLKPSIIGYHKNGVIKLLKYIKFGEYYVYKDRPSLIRFEENGDIIEEKYHKYERDSMKTLTKNEVKELKDKYISIRRKEILSNICKGTKNDNKHTNKYNNFKINTIIQ